MVIEGSNKNLNFPPHQVISGCRLSLLLSSSSPLPFPLSFLLPFIYTQNPHSNVDDGVTRQTGGQDTTYEAAMTSALKIALAVYSLLSWRVESRFMS